MAVRQCPALNSQRKPCRFTFLRQSGWCPYHDPTDPVLPGREHLRRGRQRGRPPGPVELPVYHPDFLPSLKGDRVAIHKLRAWAAEFDALDRERYSALQFVEWVTLELAPPARPRDDAEPVYSVVGAGALALSG